MLGINGSGMRSLSLLLNAQGHLVSGCDRTAQVIKSDPAFSSINIYSEEEGMEHLGEADQIIYSDAIAASHPCRQRALAKSIPQQSLFEYYGTLSADYTTIAVAGTHGKSSTTAFLGHIMISAGLDPTILLGAAVPGWPLQSARQGQSQYLLVEADEYLNHFLELKPAHAIITTIDFDHPDFFNDLNHVTASFQKFIDSLSDQGSLVISQQLHDQTDLQIKWPKQTKPSSLPAAQLKLSVPGTHMQQNAALAIKLAQQLGVTESKAIKALATFPGLSRRFETLGNLHNLTVISDYGHHPAELDATIKTALTEYPDKKILFVFEPHTTTRLSKFYQDFLMALTPAANDFGVLIAPAFRARAETDTSRDSHNLYQDLKTNSDNVWELNNFNELPALLKKLSSDYQIVVALTAGELDSRLRRLITA